MTCLVSSENLGSLSESRKVGGFEVSAFCSSFARRLTIYTCGLTLGRRGSNLARTISRLAQSKGLHPFAANLINYYDYYEEHEPLHNPHFGYPERRCYADLDLALGNAYDLKVRPGLGVQGAVGSTLSYWKNSQLFSHLLRFFPPFMVLPPSPALSPRLTPPILRAISRSLYRFG